MLHSSEPVAICASASRYSKAVCQVLVARHCMGRHTAKSNARCSQGVGGATRAQAGPLPTLPRLFSPSVKGGLGADMRTALCAHTHKACVRAQCVKICTRCAHMLAAGALSRLLHHLPFLSRLRRSAQVTMVVNSCALGCAQVCSWVVRYTGGLCVIRWVMKRWLAPINRVREVLHPLECTT